jgi:hypothetical protein
MKSLIKRPQTIIMILVFFAAGFLFSESAMAQSGQSIIVSPAASFLSPGDEITLTVRNETNADFPFKITPAFYRLDPETRSVTFETEIEPDNSFVEIDQSEGIITAGSKIDVPVRFLSTSDHLILGLRVQEASQIEGQLGVGREIVSLIINSALSSDDINSIVIDFSVEPEFQIGPFALGKNFKTHTTLLNNSEALLKVTGEVVVKSGEMYLSSYPQSTLLIDPIYPGDEKTFDNDFSDSRSLFNRIGRISFAQSYSINGQDINESQTYIIIPLELVGLGVIIMASLGLVYWRYDRQKRNPE